MDLERVLAARDVKPEELAAQLDAPLTDRPLPRPLTQRSEYVLEPISSAATDTKALKERRALVIAEVAKLRQDMDREMRAGAQRSVGMEERRERARRMDEADEQVEALYTRLRDRANEIANAYAVLKAPLLIQKAVLRSYAKKDLALTRRQPLLQGVEDRLAKLDKDQLLQVDDLQKQTSSQVKGVYANVEELVARYVQAQLAEKLREIDEKLRDDQLDLQALIAAKPATPAVSTIRQALVFEPVPPLPPMPPIGKHVGKWARSERESARKEVELWAKTNGYRLSATRSGALDLTERYIEEYVR